MIGSFALIIFLFTYKLLAKKEIWMILPLAVMLLTPEFINFWVGPITGYPFLLIYAICSYYLITKKQYVLAAILGFVASFTHSPGIVVFAAGLPLFFLREHRNLRPICIWVGTFLLAMGAYYVLIVSRGTVVRADDRSVLDLFNCAYSLVVYEGQFLALPFRKFTFFPNIPGFLAKNPHLYFIVTFGVAAFIMVLIYMARRRINAHVIVAFCFMIFCFSPGIISAFVSDDCSIITDMVAPRYIMYSLMAWCGLYIFSLSILNARWTLLLALSFLLIFTPRLYINFKRAENVYEWRKYDWFQRATFNGKTKRSLKERAIYEGTMSRGLFVPVTYDYKRVDDTEESLNLEKIDLDYFWFDLVENDSFCKLELVLPKMNIETIEIWVGSGDDLIKYIPRSVDFRRIRNNYSRNNGFPHNSNRLGGGFVFSLPQKDGCEQELRLRINDGLTSGLRDRQ